MKALTLTQPWATLISLGQKKIETRSWATSYRGRLATHAGKGLGPVGGMRGLLELLEQDVFWNALYPLQPSVFNAKGLAKLALPRGAIVATCELVAVIPTRAFEDSLTQYYEYPRGWTLTDQERAFGDYSPGRYAWLLSSIVELSAPVPVKGQLGLWKYEGEL